MEGNHRNFTPYQGRVIKRWKSLRDTYVRHKNIKSKRRDGLSQFKPK